MTDNLGSESHSVTINNVAPTVVISGDFTAVDEGTTRTYTYTVTDPGLDTPIVTEECTGDATYIGDVVANSFKCKFLDGAGMGTVTVSANDGDPTNNIGSDSHDITVNNVAPTISSDRERVGQRGLESTRSPWARGRSGLGHRQRLQHQLG